jgi:hypothetical protein
MLTDTIPRRTRMALGTQVVVQAEWVLAALLYPTHCHLIPIGPDLRAIPPWDCHRHPPYRLRLLRRRQRRQSKEPIVVVHDPT